MPHAFHIHLMFFLHVSHILHNVICTSYLAYIHLTSTPFLPYCNFLPTSHHFTSTLTELLLPQVFG